MGRKYLPHHSDGTEQQRYRKEKMLFKSVQPEISLHGSSGFRDVDFRLCDNTAFRKMQVRLMQENWLQNTFHGIDLFCFAIVERRVATMKNQGTKRLFVSDTMNAV